MTLTDEQAALSLRQLYTAYGYLQYKVGKFESYDLYLQNKRFLPSDQLLTFRDLDGRLLALKPDVTLSIIKNTDPSAALRKVCYTESVYRVPRGGDSFREILQTGLEYLGDVDDYALSEVVMLACRSLQTISEDYVLELSDLGVISGVLEDVPNKEAFLAALGQKNAHGLLALCREQGVSDETAALLQALSAVSGPLPQALPQVFALSLPEESRAALQKLQTLSGRLALYGITRVNLDFSVVNDMDYYNGLIFRGFVDSVPSGVLSGGQYDLLMEKMGKPQNAIGFAVYLDQLERFFDRAAEYDVDTVLCYDDASDPETVVKTAEALIAAGKTVRVQRQTPQGLTCRECLTVVESEVRHA